MSARDSDALGDFAKLGVECTSDNASLCAKSRVIFVCCPPSQLSRVARQVKGSLRRSSVICSLVAATPLSKLRQLFGAEAIIRSSLDTEKLRDGRAGYLHLEYEEREICEAAVEQLLSFKVAVPTALSDERKTEASTSVENALSLRSGDFAGSFYWALVHMCRTLGVGEAESHNVALSTLFVTADSRRPSRRPSEVLLGPNVSGVEEPSSLPASFASACEWMRQKWDANGETCKRNFKCSFFEKVGL